MGEVDTEINRLREEVRQLRLIIVRARATLHQTTPPEKRVQETAKILDQADK
jgi:hypothetical protein